ncbi:MAG TPA: MFS transporter [Pirellulales bacterium]|nr:MFS transporter [Pirellulales bacterium]
MESAPSSAGGPTHSPAGRQARFALALLLAINLFNYIDRYILSAALSKIKVDFFGVGDANAKFWLGTLTTAFLVSYMLGAPWFGWLADRASRWTLIGGAVFVWSLASGASGLSIYFGFNMLLVTRMFVGIGEAAYGPTAPALISDMYPIERRGQVLSWFYMAIPVGSALGYAFGGQIAEHWHWSWAFYLVVPPGLLLAVACFLMRDPQRGASESRPTVVRHANWGDYVTLLRTPSYVLNTLGMTAMTFALGGVAAWMPDYIHDYRQYGTLGHVSLVFGAITAVSGLVATLLGGLVGDKLSKRWPGAYFLVSGCGLLLAFPCFLLVLHVSFPWAWFWIFLCEFCLFFNTGPANTILANVTHPAVRATGFALNILVIHLLGDAISPPLIGLLSDRHGGDMNVAFRAVSVAILVGAVFWLWGARYLQRDTERAPTRIEP